MTASLAEHPAPYRVDPVVARAALCRAVLIAGAVATLIAAGTGLLLVNDPWRVIAVVGLVMVATGVEVMVLTRSPGIVRAPLLACAADSVFVVAVLALSRGSMAYFVYAAGAAALAGVLLGMRALVLWVAQAALGFVVAGEILRAGRPPADLAAFVLAFPMAGVVAGIGAALATSAVVRFVNLSVQALASAQRSAAASERARLARELHDSLTKTLRGISFAALALPSSLRHHPALAEQLASTVSAGAEAAAREARELLEGLRLDAPDQDFAESLRRICRTSACPSGPGRWGCPADRDRPRRRYHCARLGAAPRRAGDGRDRRSSLDPGPAHPDVMMIDVMVVDDNPIVRAALDGFLRTSDEVRVVAHAGDGREAVVAARRLQPDVILLDHRMPVADGLSVIDTLARYSAVLVLTSDADPALISAMLRRGARGYLVHGAFDPPELLRAVLAVAGGQGWLSPVAASAVAAALREQAAQERAERERVEWERARRAQYGLTDREQEVLDLVCRGMSNASVASRLRLTEKTVKNHLNHVFTKLRVRNRTEAVVRWTGRE